MVVVVRDKMVIPVRIDPGQEPIFIPKIKVLTYPITFLRNILSTYRFYSPLAPLLEEPNFTIRNIWLGCEIRPETLKLQGGNRIELSLPFCATPRTLGWSVSKISGLMLKGCVNPLGAIT